MKDTKTPEDSGSSKPLHRTSDSTPSERSMLDSSVHCTRCGYGLSGGTCDNGCVPIREKITVGDFLNPITSDAVFRCLPDAMELAEAESRRDDNAASAVWIGDELHRVFLRGYELRCV